MLPPCSVCGRKARALFTSMVPEPRWAVIEQTGLCADCAEWWDATRDVVLRRLREPRLEKSR